MLGVTYLYKEISDISRGIIKDTKNNLSVFYNYKIFDNMNNQAVISECIRLT